MWCWILPCHRVFLGPPSKVQGKSSAAFGKPVDQCLHHCGGPTEMANWHQKLKSPHSRLRRIRRARHNQASGLFPTSCNVSSHRNWWLGQRSWRQHGIRARRLVGWHRGQQSSTPLREHQGAELGTGDHCWHHSLSCPPVVDGGAWPWKTAKLRCGLAKT